MAPSFLAILLDSVLLALFRIFKKGHIQEFLFGKGLVGGGGGGGGWSKLFRKRTVEHFCGKLRLTETTMCFSICERRSPLAREVLLWEHRRTDHRKVPKNNYIF